MIRALKDNWALFAGMLMLMMANGMLVTFLSIRGAAIGFSETTIGLVQAGYPLGALVGSVYAPRLVERVGHVRAFATLASLCSVCAIVHLLTADAWSWGAMRFLAGVCFPGLYVISESWLNAKAENRTRAIVLSVYFVIQTVGAAAGQGLAGLDETSGAMTFGLSSILVSLSLLPLMISRTRAPDYSAPDRFSMRQLARISPMAVSGATLNGVAQAAFYVGMPLYGLARGMSAADSALLLVIGTLSGAAAQFPVGWISDRTDRRYVVGGLSLSSMAVGLGLASGSFGDHVYVAVALIGALTLPVYSICVAHANDQIAPNQIVSASGTLVLALNVGILVGAVAGPFAIGAAGPSGLAMLFTAISAVMVAIAFLRRVRAKAPRTTRMAQPIAALGAQTTGVMHPQAKKPPDHEAS